VSGLGPLLGLLVLAYVGSMLVSGRTIRGFGLPSGAEYLVLGVIIGPHALGLLTRSNITTFEPIFVLGASWMALVAGLGYGIVGGRRIHPGRALAGIVFGVAAGAGVASALAFAFDVLDVLPASERPRAALAAGIVCSETTRHSVRWVVERHGARGPVSDWVADMARASALVPLLGLGWLMASAPSPLLEGTALERLGVTLAVGAVLGIVSAVLLGREFRRDESWGILLGTSVLGAGLSAKIGLSSMATLFVMGLTLALVSRHRLEIKFMVQVSEKPVVLPVLLAAGASVAVDGVPKLGWVVAAALAARVGVELARGLFVAAVVPSARPAWAEVGLGMSSTGALALAAAYTLRVRVPGASSDAVLLVAAASVLLGEAVGPALLRRAITRTGEAHAGGTDEASPVSLRPPSHLISEYPPEVSR
jgi:hypothetical protein